MEFATASSGKKVTEEMDMVLFEYLQQQAAFGNPQNQAVVRQEIVESVEEQKRKGKGETPSYRKILPRMPQYYYTISLLQQPSQDYFFVYTPGGITINRVSQAQLGSGVLGVAYPGANLIMIADHLFGLDFEEVKKHEIIHILYPFLTEFEVRQKTKRELPFDTRYH